MPNGSAICEKRTYRNKSSREGDYAYANTRVRLLPQRSSRSERGYDIATHFAKVIAARHRNESPTLVEQVFREHAKRWWQETRILSSIQAKIFNPHYQRIIGLGRAALPFIFSDLRDHGGQWYWALECITGENPAEGTENLPEAKELWLEYARRYSYL